MKLEIRQELRTDFSQVYELNQVAFGQDADANLVSLLRKGNAFIPELSLVAIIDNNIVGYVLFTKIIIKEHRGDVHNSLSLAPMAVRPDFQKKVLVAGLSSKVWIKQKNLNINL